VAVKRALLVTLLASSVAYAQEPPAPDAPPTTGAPEEPPELQTPSELLRSGNAAATSGEWAKVSTLVTAALRVQLPTAQLAEAHRLAGLAAYFTGDRANAEQHFLAYLRLDLDGQLDPALYPPDAIVFFTDVKTKYSDELRARRPQAKRYAILSVIPVVAQLQNGDRTKALVLGAAITAFAGTNIGTYAVLKSWCSADHTCDGTSDHTSAAGKVRAVNIASGVGLILTLGYGVYDGVTGYRRDTREHAAQPMVSLGNGDAFVGVAGDF
jgi:hypothetical protein